MTDKGEKSGRGVIYCATGEQYIRRATLSASSLKKNTPGLECCIFTDGAADGEIWDRVIPIEKSRTDYHQYMLDKLIVLNSSPYKDTLYLDSDTYILDDLNELFNILERFDMAVCHGHDRQKRYLIQHGRIPVRGELKEAASSDIPYAFAPLQGGLMLYRSSEKTEAFLRDLFDLYKTKDFYDDQVSIRELLWSSDLRFYILPPEYNFNSVQILKYWKKFHFRHARPKIFHYTQNKNSRIDRLVLSILKNKSTEYRDP
jgi:hypothetical protein